MVYMLGGYFNSLIAAFATELYVQSRDDREQVLRVYPTSVYFSAIARRTRLSMKQ